MIPRNIQGHATYIRHYAHGRHLTIVLTLIFSLLSFGAHAEQLTDNTIRSFIQSLEAAQAMGPEFEEFTNEQENINKLPDLSRIFSSSVEAAEGHKAYGQMEDLAQDHGFKNIDEWANTGDRIYSAWLTIEMGDESAGFQQEMSGAMAEIENNPNMSAEQKAQMRAAMQAAMGITQQANNAPAADIEAVKPHLNALRTFMESE